MRRLAADASFSCSAVSSSAVARVAPKVMSNAPSYRRSSPLGSLVATRHIRPSRPRRPTRYARPHLLLIPQPMQLRCTATRRPALHCLPSGLLLHRANMLEAKPATFHLLIPPLATQAVNLAPTRTKPLPTQRQATWLPQLLVSPMLPARPTLPPLTLPHRSPVLSTASALDALKTEQANTATASVQVEVETVQVDPTMLAARARMVISPVVPVQRLLTRLLRRLDRTPAQTQVARGVAREAEEVKR